MQPLKGLKVVDLTTFLATPTTGRILGEWGADVIKVEAFKGDPCRTNQAVVFGMPSSDEENLAFDVANFHKRFVALNLKSEKGNEVMMKLLEDADVFITNTRTKSLAKMGLEVVTFNVQDVKDAMNANPELEIVETTYQGDWVSITARRK